jgi:hypothetical protein
MYQLEKLSLLYDVCKKMFTYEESDYDEYDYFAFDIIEVENNFMSCDAKFMIRYEEIEYLFVFDDDDENITVYKNDDKYAVYSIEYKDTQSYVKKLAQY